MTFSPDNEIFARGSKHIPTGYGVRWKTPPGNLTSEHPALIASISRLSLVLSASGDFIGEDIA